MFYVSVTNGKKYVALAGPYDTHDAALAAVPEARRKAFDADPRAPWYAYGTCRTDSSPKTAFGVL